MEKLTVTFPEEIARQIQQYTKSHYKSQDYERAVHALVVNAIEDEVDYQEALARLKESEGTVSLEEIEKKYGLGH